MEQKHHTPEKEHAALGESLWMESEANPNLAAFYRGETSFQDFVATIAPEILMRAFELRDRSLRCIDERTPGGVHLAGSGILQDTEDAIASARAAQVDGVYSHAGCGAASLYVKREGLDSTQTEEYAQQRAEFLASQLRVPYKGHLPVDPPIHNARVAYYGSDIDPSPVEDLPAGFAFSRTYYNKKENAVAELALAPQIAMGEHGFGHKFTEAIPFVVIAVGKTPEEIEQYRNEAAEMIEQLPDEMKHRVRVDQFLMAASL